jgi:hypothetical protein
LFALSGAGSPNDLYPVVLKISYRPTACSLQRPLPST